MNTSATSNRQNQTTHTELSRDEVARRAYQLWETAGCPAGQDLAHWLQAEEELLYACHSHRVTFGTSNSDPVFAIASVKRKSTRSPAVGRKNGAKLNARSR
jgi:hypothetical protein